MINTEGCENAGEVEESIAGYYKS